MSMAVAFHALKLPVSIGHPLVAMQICLISDILIVELACFDVERASYCLHHLRSPKGD